MIKEAQRQEIEDEKRREAYRERRSRHRAQLLQVVAEPGELGTGTPATAESVAAPVTASVEQKETAVSREKSMLILVFNELVRNAAPTKWFEFFRL